MVSNFNKDYLLINYKKIKSHSLYLYNNQYFQNQLIGRIIQQ